RMAIEGLRSTGLLLGAHCAACMQVGDAPDAGSDCRDIPAREMAVLREPVALNPARSFPSHPAWGRRPHARLCAAQPSPPFFFVFPRRVCVPSSVARPGLDDNSA